MSETLQIVPIGDLIQTKNDKSKQLQSNDYQSNGVLPVVDQGAKPVCGYTNDLSKRYDKGLPVIIFGDHTLHTKFIDFNFAIGADGTQVIVPKNHDCDAKYLYYLISRAANLIGSEGYKRHFKILKEFDIEYIEPLPAQQKIAAILSSADDVIEKTRAQIDKLKDLKTGMMQELLTKGIGHTEFKDSPVGRIPVSWNVTRLGDVTQKFQNGYAFKASGYVDEGIPIISMASIGLDGNFNAGYSKTKHWDAGELRALERYIVQDGDLLIAMTDVTPTMELIGRCCIAQISQPHLLNQRVGLIRLDSSRVNKHFVAYYSNHEIWRDYARGMSGLGAQANLGTPQIANGIIPLPPLEEQEQIASILQSIDKIIKAKEEKASKGQAAKKALMQDLLTGKVRVKVDQKESAVA